MPASVTVPSFKFAVFFYPEILAELRVWLRANVPEITDENDFEIAVQMLKAFALVGHLNSVNTDAAANEAIFGTAKLLESVRQHFKLIGLEPASASPATTLLAVRFNKFFDVTTDVIPAYAQFASAPAEGESGVVFEYVADAPLSINRNDQLTYAKGEDGGTFADYITEVLAGTPWSPWATPSANDAVYWGHDSVLFDDLEFITIVGGTDFEGVWEFYSGDYDQGNPDTVTNPGNTLRFNLNTILGDTKATGSLVRVQHNPTGTYEEIASLWDGSDNYIVTTTLLGQSSPSVATSDYTVGAAWRRIVDIVDGTSGLLATETEPVAAAYTAPLATWNKTTVDGDEAYWLRFRVVDVGGAPASPTLSGVDFPDAEATWLTFTITQGQRILQQPLATGDGQASQQYTLARTTYLDNTLQIDIDEGSGFLRWTEVENFLNSSSLDRHFTVEVGAEDIVEVEFGTGDNGKIPSVGAIINGAYRIGADVDGNVAIEAITINRSGVGFITDIQNPVAASGWAVKRGSTTEDLEALKVEGPAEIRTLGRATTGPDFPVVARLYRDAGGSNPIARSFAVVDELGPKTVGLHIVGNGGNMLTADVLEDIEDFFNGDDGKDYVERILMNYELGAQNYGRKTITVAATITASGVTEGQIKAALMTLLNPLALNSDGITWRWNFGEKVPTAKIIAAIDEVAPDLIEDIVLTTPASDVYLNPDELPWTVNTDLTITIVS